jgi:ubiquinone/menaquinone biosynthesis C-methylase UbiE
MTIYQAYAEVYDASGQLAFSQRMVPYLRQLFECHAMQGDTLVDLACGTGTVAIALAAEGWRVEGIDASQAMLVQARQKAGKQGLEIAWSQQDMRSFTPAQPVHVVTCLYDSMNYMLSDQDLLATFRQVYRALLPGGHFIFDMNTVWALAEMWGDDTYLSDSDDLTVAITSYFDRQTLRATVAITGFVREGELYRKFVEHHTEQAYPPEHVATLLTDVGLRFQAQYACFSFDAPTHTTPRIVFLARKPTRAV